MYIMVMVTQTKNYEFSSYIYIFTILCTNVSKSIHKFPLASVFSF